MYVTKSFVFVHMPKTGGTFVADILRQLHTPFGQDGWRNSLFMVSNFVVKQLRLDAPYVEIVKHGPCRDIPARYVHLPILSCMRNPLDWYVSNYKYQYWRKHPEIYPGLREDPQWPDLTFGHYMELSNRTWIQTMNPGVAVNPSLGRLTTLFIQYYCREPEKILNIQAEDDPLFKAIQDNMYPVTFLDTRRLNDELSEWLLEKGYSAQQIEFVRTRPPISPGGHRKPGDRWQKFYTPDVIQEVYARDRFLFHLFPQFATPE